MILQRLLTALNSSPFSLGPHELVSQPCWNCTQLDPVYVTASAVMSEVTLVPRRQHCVAPLSSTALTFFLPHLLQCSLRLDTGVIKNVSVETSNYRHFFSALSPIRTLCTDHCSQKMKFLLPRSSGVNLNKYKAGRQCDG